jgi:RNA ligase (TIGR02306 family)
MSTFEVALRIIDKIEPHPNAEKLELVVVGGWRCVVKKDIHHHGDMVLYIPEDALFHDRTVAEQLGVADYLTGKYKNRVKAVKLRGILSQGIVLPFEALSHYVFANFSPEIVHQQLFYCPIGRDYAEFLQIEKYEEPIPIEMMGHVRPWPAFLGHYDIENIKRPECFNVIQPNEEVVFTEKLHGTNMTVAVGPGLDEPNELAFVCSRRMAIKESELNVYWRAAAKHDLVFKLRSMLSDNQISAEWDVEQGAEPITSMGIHGEVVGVQDLKYGYVNGDIGFYAFDISINGKFVNYDVFVNLCDDYDIPRVPELYRGPYHYDTLVGLAEGASRLAGHLREGGVVKPVIERSDLSAGRVAFKLVSEAYLTRQGDTTEFH